MHQCLVNQSRYRLLARVMSLTVENTYSVKCNSIGSALECYVCKDQEDNKQKCLTTIKTCEPGEDACLTEVSWRTMPYWQRGADKQFYISKRCATRAICEKARKRAMPYCTHIWYEDWRCSECCLGDRCNYYVILSGSTARSNFLLLAGSVAAVLMATYFLR
ncbi:hypothetical protein RUM43_006376 [Polyplax serrata]|uniref:Uncharacterized protein n=1 Tax=Polyplax serrata TaxID=468196 RepID=A0AAN8NRX7_POLSC